VFCSSLCCSLIGCSRPTPAALDAAGPGRWPRSRASGGRGRRARHRGGAAEGEHLLHSFLTAEPNGIVGPIHSKAMPVILTAPEVYETWLTAPVDAALKLQRPLPDGMLEIVAEGARSDQPDAA
jgi:hypothetical protein